MAIRVLATIPDLSPAASAAVGRRRPGHPERTRANTAVAHADDGTAPEASGRKRSIRPVDKPRFRRRKSRAIFPSGSITVLAIIAAGIWSYVAVRDMRRPQPAPTGERIAAETASLDKGTTRR